jgi:hypothetical protein
MKTYDPADAIAYVHMVREVDPYSTPLESGRTCMRLPVGYANKSSRTSLGDRLKMNSVRSRGRLAGQRRPADG